MASLAEISERDATGRVAELYGQIRAALGVPIVNLVFRHMATRPGCLEWVCAIITSLGASGRLAAARNDIVRAGQLTPSSALTKGELAALGVEGESEATIRAVLDAYNLTNPVNLVVFSLLARLLAEPPSSAAKMSPALMPPLPPVPRVNLPPVVDLGTVDEHLREILRVLAEQAGEKRGDLVPTIYRQLVAWPRFLAWIADFLAPYAASGRIDTSAAEIRRVATEKAVELARVWAALGVGTLPEAIDMRDLIDTIERFPPLIARMIAIGTLLQSALPRQV